MSGLKIWLMHDNHTFTLLPNSAESAAETIAKLLENGNARFFHIFYHINSKSNEQRLFYEYTDIDGDRKFVQDTKKLVKDAINAYAEYERTRPPTPKEREEKLIEAAYWEAIHYNLALEKEDAKHMLEATELGIVDRIYELAGLERLK